MASKRRHLSDRDFLQQYGRRDWKPWTIGATIVLVLGVIVYACSGAAGAQPDIYHWLWPRPAPAPPVVIPEVPAARPPSPEPPPAAPVTPIPWPSPPVIMPPPVVVLPPAAIEPAPVQHRQIRQPTRSKLLDRKKEGAKVPIGKPATAKPKQQVSERLPSCAEICRRTRGKSMSELISMGMSYNPSPQLKEHGIACYWGCRK